ncbi:MAG: DUF5107 domain-containing protein [Clostridia bacterium]|nr:DUF5107 domain-containing protein [Clostridia bacterium]
MSNVISSIEKLTIPTYPEPAAESLPMFAENRVHQRSSGRPYPNKIVLKVDREHREDKEYTVVRLENEYLCLYILPEIGGRVYAAKDKTTGYDFFYKQHVIKPALIGALGSWVSGGIEFNWPFHHRASGYLPCDFHLETCEDGSAICWLSEHDPIDRMKGMVGIVLKPGEAKFETRMRLYNRTPVQKSFLWWENAAVPVNEDYRIFFPKDVTYVNFHYLKSRTTYPIAGNCVFNGIDMMKDTVDISWHKNTKQATSYFASASKYDFFGGYDYGKDCGVVHIGNHHISPGKKMFTWAYCQLAKSWENALTDTDGQYAELMAGSYSDNQPNFAWLQPYETKEFSQHWYPITKIGCPVFANLNGAFNLERDGEKAVLKVQSTIEFKNAEITVLDGEKVLFTANADLNPCEPVQFDINFVPEFVTVKVVANGRTVLNYTEEKPDNFKMPDVIEDTPSAESLDSVQQLYLAGVHVDQYRDPAIYPDGYWLEALKKDPKHIPTLIAMARYSYRLNRFEEAKGYIERAIKELCFLNTRTESGEAYYVAGLINQAMGNSDEAYDYFYKAAWVGTEYDKAMTRIAMIDLKRKDFDAAIHHTKEALSKNVDNALAVAMRAIAFKKLGEEQKAAELCQRFLSGDPLSHTVRFVTFGDDMTEFFAPMDSSASQTTLDIVWDLAEMGLYEEIVHVLNELIRVRKDEATAIVYYTLAYFENLLGMENKNVAFGDVAEIGFTFPARAGEIDVLKFAATPKANFLLGCLHYAARNIDEAEVCWNNAKDYEDKAAVLRNLAMLTFNYRADKEVALPMMLKAVELAPDSEELVYETVILMDKTAYPADKKVEFIKAHMDIITRDDILTELAKAHNQNGDPDAALEVLLNHDFVPCEGGEHAIADQFIFAHFLKGQRLLSEGNHKAAIEEFRTAQVLPQNLGAGIWNHCKHIPCRYFEAICLDAMGDNEGAKKIYTYITETVIEYFSNMHLKELPYYQAMSYRRMGEELKGVLLMTKYRRIWNEALTKKDTGYFGTTPFFLPFVDRPELARTAQFSYLAGLCEEYMGNFDTADELINKAYSINTELQFAGFYGKKIK